MNEEFKTKRMELWIKAYADAIWNEKSREDAVLTAGIAVIDFCEMFTTEALINA